MFLLLSNAAGDDALSQHPGRNSTGPAAFSQIVHKLVGARRLTGAYGAGGSLAIPGQLHRYTNYWAAGITMAKTADTLAVTSTSPELICVGANERA